MTATKGLQFKKFDLHIHTPASTDFEGSATPEQIVSVALGQGLAGIAVTDHQTAAWVDRVKEAAKNTPLAIFPGVELLVAGGESGVHIILLFDVDKSTEHVHQFLNTVGIFTKDGKPTLASELTVGQVSDKLRDYDSEAVLILAHCHSSKGVTGEIRGEVRTQIFQPRRKNLLGAEASESDFRDNGKAATHKRVIDVFDGTDPNYHYRKLGVYQASDAHSLIRIGESPTYFKVDEPIAIEDIRQSLIDRDTRIRQPYEFSPVVYPRINSIRVTSGFLADQTLEFHDGLNSLLGAKGSGKSLVIEMLRFALNQAPTLPSIREDHLSKIDKCVRVHGMVEVAITDESGKEYTIQRIYKPGDGSPTKIIDRTDGAEKNFQIDEAFPVLFLSQNEIIKIAEDQTGASLRGFIDRFFDFYRFQHEIERLTKALTEIDSQLTESLKSHRSVLDAQKKLATYKEEIEKLGRQITNAVFERYAHQEEIGRALSTQLEFTSSLRETLVSTENTYRDLKVPATENDKVNAEPAVKRAADAVSRAIAETAEQLKGAGTAMEREQAAIQAEYDEWEVGFKTLRSEYDKVVKETGGTQVALDQRRRRLLNDLSGVERDLARHSARAQQLRSLTIQRNDLLDKLDAAHRAYYEERRARCEYFTDNSHGALRVTIREREDKSEFQNQLLMFKKGSWLRDDEIEKITATITPRELVRAILRFEHSGRSERTHLQELAAKAGLRTDAIEKLVTHLLEDYEYKQILSLMYNAVPKDVPSISYKVAGEFKPLADLSVGQKAVALLIIALSDGTFPIVIDQPEDSLDLRSIWDDVCTTLRGAKEKRQFIFTTHNSSVAVASDTDRFTILQAEATRAKVLYSGSMNRQQIRSEVIDYLEGGQDTYAKKREKYNL